MRKFCSVQEAKDEFKTGHMLIVVDHPQREDQGDLVFPAQTTNKEKVNFMMQVCRGMICVAITKAKAAQLNLPLMVDPIHNTEKTKVNFTVSVDAKNVSSFGISAADRAQTIKVIASQRSKPTDLVRPGHVFPLVAADDGLMKRQGHTEAAIELARLAAFAPCAVLCEIIRDDGKIASLADLSHFSQKFKIKMVSIDDLYEYLRSHPQPKKEKEVTIIKEATSYLLTQYGRFQIAVYRSLLDNREHVSLIMGKVRRVKKQPILVRIHSQCLTGDTFLGARCDCRDQLHRSMRMIAESGQGVIVYLNQEGRGIGLANKIKAYALQERGLDTVEANHALGFPADARSYQVAADILKDQGIAKIVLLSNNPHKSNQLAEAGIFVVKRVPLKVVSNKMNRHYLQTKKQKLAHSL